MPIPSSFWAMHYKQFNDCCMNDPMDFYVDDTGKKVYEYIDLQDMYDKKLKWAGWNKEGDVIWITPSGIMYRFKDLKRNAAGKKYEQTVRKLYARYEGQPRVKLLPKTNKKGEAVMDDSGNYVYLGFYESELEGLKKCEYCSDKMATPSSGGEESGTAGSDRYGGIPVGDPANTDYSKMGQGFGMPPGGYIDAWGPVIDKGPVLGGSWGGDSWQEDFGLKRRMGGDGGEKKTPHQLTPPPLGVRRFPVDPVPDIKTPPVWIVPRDIIDTGPVTGGKKPVPVRRTVPQGAKNPAKPIQPSRPGFQWPTEPTGPIAGMSPHAKPKQTGLEPREDEEDWALQDFGHIKAARKMELNAHKASFEAARSGLPDENEGAQNAFKHALWNAMNVRDEGLNLARDFAYLHEEGAEESDPKSKKYDPVGVAMDHHNNKVGQQIALKHPNATDQQYVNLVKQAIKNGELLMIKIRRNQDGKRVPVNANNKEVFDKKQKLLERSRDYPQ